MNHGGDTRAYKALVALEMLKKIVDWDEGATPEDNVDIAWQYATLMAQKLEEGNEESQTNTR